MTLITMMLATAGMSLGLVGPEGAKTAEAECETKACCATKEGAKDTCGMCEKMDGDEKCAMCAAHADATADDAGAKMTNATYTEVTKPASALYASAAWPTHNSGDSLYAKDYQGKALPVALGNETWISEQVNTEGKVIVLDFWATWCPPCRAATPILDQLQKDHKDDLAVLAIGGQSEDEDTVRSYLKDHKETISNLFDADQTILSKFESKGIPLVVIMSTDGVVRWIGNPHDQNFKKALAQVIKVDPMVNAKS